MAGGVSAATINKVSVVKVSEQSIREVLASVTLPEDLGVMDSSNSYVRKLRIQGAKVSIELLFYFPVSRIEPGIIEAFGSAVMAIPGVDTVDVTIQTKIQARAVQSGVTRNPSVKNIIAIGSGKGGVGKSTTTVNLALALMQEGAKVGILDADIYGPNQPFMLGATEKPEITPIKQFKPVDRYGIQSMSIGYLVNEKTPMVWRGPMVSGALQQLFRDTLWGELDYLLVDLPPGTGDIQLTLAKKIPVSGAVIVTTPQDVALQDAQKAFEMFNKVNIKTLGVVENMVTHVCTQCGHEEAIFGADGASEFCHNNSLPLLGQLPLALQIRQDISQGKPSVIADPDSAIANRYRMIARKMAATLAQQPKDYSEKFNVVVE